MHIRKLVLSVCVVCLTVPVAFAQDEFYPIDSVSIQYPDDIGGDFWPASNLIQGPGVGFEADEPYEKFGGGADNNWVTTADCGYPADYIDCVGEPVIFLDLGQDRALDEISMWGYEDTNTNGWREFSLRFASDADGADGYGSSISYNPTFIQEDFFEYLAVERQSFDFSENVNARYVELTVTDNYFDDPGDGTGEEGWGPGGDRVGIGEIAFRASGGFEPPTPEPGIDFYDIADITSSMSDSDLWPASNLIAGPGEGFSASEPYASLGGGPDGAWVTADPGGFPSDYLEVEDPPELIIDLGEDVALNEIDVWGYSSGNANGVLEFELEFATAADGDDGFGASISYNPTFGDVELDPTIRQQFSFEEEVMARYVKFIATDNYYEDPGDGTGELGRPPGGDRVGLSEIAFPVITDIDPLAPLDDGRLTDPQERADYVHNILGTWFGDSNLDGEFNSSDLVLVFSEGLYETGDKAGWAAGDWDGDMQFGSSDLVTAFIDGGYEAGPRPDAVVAVPEPSALVLAFVAALGLLRLRRR